MHLNTHATQCNLVIFLINIGISWCEICVIIKLVGYVACERGLPVYECTWGYPSYNDINYDYIMSLEFSYLLSHIYLKKCIPYFSQASIKNTKEY